MRALIAVACWAIGPAAIVRAQETINHASVSGRVTDSQGLVVPGARVAVRQTDTNVSVETVSDSDGRFRFPYLKVGPYELRVRMPGFLDSTRTLTLSVGSAFDVPVTLTVSGVDATVTVTGESIALETARSQIAGTVSQAEV